MENSAAAGGVIGQADRKLTTPPQIPALVAWCSEMSWSQLEILSQSPHVKSMSKPKLRPCWILDLITDVHL